MKKLRKIVSIFILAVIILLFIYYLKKHISDFKQLSFVAPQNILMLLFFYLFTLYTNGLIIKYFAEPFNIYLKFMEWFGLSVITSFYNMITPFKGGLAVKAIYLKENHNFSYSEYLGTVAGLYVINFFIASLCGLLSLLIVYLKYGIFNFVIVSIFSTFFISMLFVIIIAPSFKYTKNDYLNKIKKVLNGWNVIRRNSKIIVLSSTIVILQLIIGSINGMFAYYIFGINLTFEKALYLCSLGVLSILIQITPSGLGVSEVIIVFSALIIGITPAQSLSVALLARIINTILVIILGPIYSYILLKNETK